MPRLSARSRISWRQGRICYPGRLKSQKERILTVALLVSDVALQAEASHTFLAPILIVVLSRQAIVGRGIVQV